MISNRLIQDGILPKLDILEYRILLYMISLIKPGQAAQAGEPVEYTFEVGYLCDVLGICSASGRNYSRIKSAMKSLRDKSVWFCKDGVEETVSILSKVWICRGSGLIKYTFDDTIAPYLFDICENTTRSELYSILRMKSVYAYPIYLLCRSYAGIGGHSYSYEELRRHLRIGNDELSRFFDFEKYVLKKAIEEINRYTDLQISYSVDSRSHAIALHVREKSRDSKLEIFRETDYLLDITVELNHEKSSDKKQGRWTEL